MCSKSLDEYLKINNRHIMKTNLKHFIAYSRVHACTVVHACTRSYRAILKYNYFSLYILYMYMYHGDQFQPQAMKILLS